MDKTGNKYIKDFPPAKLYLNDLEMLLSLFDDNCDEVTFKTGEYDNIKPSELHELVEKLNTNKFEDIYIHSRSPYMHLDLRSYGIEAYVSESNPQQLGIVAQAKDIINTRRKRYIESLSNLFINIPLFGGFILAILGEWELTAIAFGLSFLMIWPATSYKMAHTVEVFTTPKKNHVPFFKRKKDELLIAVSSAFLGALFSFLMVKYFGQA